MDITKALQLVESAANRPLDQINGDQQPTGVEDPSGGAGGLGAPANRPADQLNGDDPEGLQQPIQDVTPDNVIPESMSRKFETIMNESIAEFKVDVKDSAKSLFESIELDEEFAAKAIGIFEAAVNEAASNHLKSINKVAGNVMEKVITSQVKRLEEQAEKHMNHVVAEWATENRLAIEQGVRVQVAESLMEGLKSLLEAHYVELPENKKDLYEAAIEKGDEILSKYNAERSKNVALSEEISSMKKSLIIERASRGMVATKAEKLRSIAEGLEFDENFEGKVAALKEEVSKPEVQKTAKVESITEDVSPIVESLSEDKREKVADQMVEKYLSFLNRQ